MTRRTSRHLLVSLALLCTGMWTGCVSLHVSGSEPQVSYGIGIVNVQLPSAGDTPIMVAIDGIGLVGSAHSLTLGTVKERVAVFPRPSACHTMVVVQSKAEFEAILRLLREQQEKLGTLCVANEERS